MDASMESLQSSVPESPPLSCPQSDRHREVTLRLTSRQRGTRRKPLLAGLSSRYPPRVEHVEKGDIDRPRRRRIVMFNHRLPRVINDLRILDSKITP